MVGPAARELRLIVLSAEFPPVGGGGVLRVVKLVKYLPAFGWRVTVITSDERLANAYDESLLREVPRSVHVVRISAPLAATGGTVARGMREQLGRGSLIIGLLRAMRAAVRSLWAIPDHRLPWALTVSRRDAAPVHGRPDIIISTGPPHSVHVGASILARRKQIPHVMDLRDEWTLRPLTRSRLPWRVALERRLERWCIRRAAAVVLVSEESRERYAAAYPRFAARFSLIPNGFDPEDLEELPHPAPRTDGTLTLGYAGSFQAGTDIRPMLAAVGDVTRGGVDGRCVRFEMVGPFLPHELDVARQSIGADALTIRPFMPHRSVLGLMAGWDGLCVIATDGRASLAGKLYECLALRRPIVVIAAEGPATRLVRELEVGAVGRPDDADSIGAAIRDALRMGTTFQGASDEALALYDRRRQAERWSNLLRALVERAS